MGDNICNQLTEVMNFIPAIARFAMKMFIRDLNFLVRKMMTRTTAFPDMMNRKRMHRYTLCSV